MATLSKPAASITRRHLIKIMSPLVSSMRGQILLLNLDVALPMLEAVAVRAALLSVSPKDASRMHEEDYLPHLKAKLQAPAVGLAFRCKATSFPDFAPDGWVVNVLPFASYRAYYEHPSAALVGHIALNAKVGNSTGSFSPVASTAPMWWMAARNSVHPPKDVRSDAQAARDALGLVHYGADLELVAMHLQPISPDIYRPTVVEANPNARFRHRDPLNPTESRWGKTIHLDRLETSPASGDIGGVPELVSSQTELKHCTAVEFHYLGKTASDRSTTSMDKKFLDHLLDGRSITTIFDHLVDELTK